MKVPPGVKFATVLLLLLLAWPLEAWRYVVFCALLSAYITMK